ncbi:hypothetical protein SAMN06265360_11495 [Haloechinothrix alba]|uniref:Uncharacterized protein n=1 Tax=Haloechinothrix alba TaxID=664784 RepID=A0A238Y9Z7_9PSEU|nr:hypothetical protein [Haloechinothrix alba]SNR68065.1 hypothetical protein SAMN06265360_11495 [Haloechinothrix alba]
MEGTGTVDSLEAQQEADTEYTGYVHPLDRLVPDPSGKAPLCDEETFAAILSGIVADEAPRLFAVVQEYGRRVDARIAGWGLAFDDRAEVVSIDGALRMKLNAPEEALRGFGFGSHVSGRLVWFDPDAVTPDP